MKVLLWLLRGIVFVALFGLAVKNSGPVDLRFYLDSIWQAPLSVVILIAFAAGAAVGLTATIVTLVRQGRELRQLRVRSGSSQSAGRS
jgi:putative membrane protein